LFDVARSERPCGSYGPDGQNLTAPAIFSPTFFLGTVDRAPLMKYLRAGEFAPQTPDTKSVFDY
jgi:hypothetical protein